VHWTEIKYLKHYFNKGVLQLSKVSIIQSQRSSKDVDVYDLVKRSIDFLGGIESVVDEGDFVALKPNIVTGRVSGPGVITDKRVVKTLIHLCKDAGAKSVMVVEGSGYFTPTEEAFEKSGIAELAETNGADVVNVDEDNLIKLKVPDPLIIEEIPVSKTFMEADVRINLPIMKTHDQLLVTLGVKNLKGVIPKQEKRHFHRIGVVKAIIDLSKVIPIDLTVLDAINAMEGLGPSFGDAVNLNTIITSKDIWSLDLIASKVMGFKPDELDYLIEADNHGVVDLHSDIMVLGTPIEEVSRRFKRPPTDLDFAEGITVISEGACSACRGTIHSVIYDLEQMNLLGEIRDLNIIVGPNAEVPEGLKNTPLIMGSCLSHLAEKGYHVIGCPPNNDKMITAIKSVCGLSD